MTGTDMMIGEAIRRQREKRNLSPLELAVATNIPEIVVHRIETGSQRAAPEQLVIISIALKIRLSQLFEGLFDRDGRRRACRSNLALVNKHLPN